MTSISKEIHVNKDEFWILENYPQSETESIDFGQSFFANQTIRHNLMRNFKGFIVSLTIVLIFLSLANYWFLLVALPFLLGYTGMVITILVDNKITKRKIRKHGTERG